MREEGGRRWVGSNKLVKLKKKKFFSLTFENMKKGLICAQDYLLVYAKFL